MQPFFWKLTGKSLLLWGSLFAGAVQAEVQCFPNDQLDQWQNCLQALSQRTPPSVWLPELLTYLSANPGLPWYQALRSPQLPTLLMPQLQTADDAIRQQVLRYFLYQAQLPKAQQAPLTPELKNHLQSELVKLTRHPDPGSQQLSLHLLAKMFPNSSKSFLKNALTDENAATRVLALQDLQRLEPNKAPLNREQVMQWLQQEPQSLETLQQLLPELKLSENDFHSWLANWMDKQPSTQLPLTETSVEALLQHPQPAVRAFALQRLARTGEMRYQAAIKAAFEDPDTAVRTAAYEALEKLKTNQPLRHLQVLKDLKQLPSDTPERIRQLMDNPQHRASLLGQGYAHLRGLPAYQQGLARLLQSQSDPQILSAVLQQWQGPLSLETLKPLLATHLPAALRQQALSKVLKLPPSPEIEAFLASLGQDPDPVLPLWAIDYFAQQANLSQLQALLSELGSRPNTSIPLTNGQTTTLQAYLKGRFKNWLSWPDPQGQVLSQWLQWAGDRRLPLSWRQEVVRQVGEKGRTRNLLPLLQQLMLEKDLAFAAEFAHQALRIRLGL